MADEKSNRKFKKMVFYGVAGLCSLILLIIGYSLEYFSHSQGGNIHRKELIELLSHISNEAGVAFLIAIVLAFTIEKLTFEEFRDLLDAQTKAIKTNVYNYIAEHSVPPEITREIETQILKAVFVRRDLKISYTIEPVSEDGAYADYVKVSLTLKYEIENLTSGDMPFEIKHTVERSPEPLLDSEVKFISIEVSGCENPISMKEAELDKIQTWVGPDLVLIFRDVVVHPQESQVTTVTVKSQTIKHFKGGMDYHMVRHHTCNVGLRVHVHKLDLDVEAGSVAHIRMNEQEDAEPADGIYHWKSQRPLLAGQHIYVTWMPRMSDEANSLNPPPEPAHSQPA
jgi:hypothetical protein